MHPHINNNANTPAIANIDGGKSTLLPFRRDWIPAMRSCAASPITTATRPSRSLDHMSACMGITAERTARGVRSTKDPSNWTRLNKPRPLVVSDPGPWVRREGPSIVSEGYPWERTGVSCVLVVGTDDNVGNLF